MRCLLPILFFHASHILPQFRLFLIFGLIGTLQNLGGPLALTGGGPGNATMVPGLQIYYLAFSEREVGMASALAMVLMVLVIACALPIQRLTKDGNG